MDVLYFFGGAGLSSACFYFYCSLKSSSKIDRSKKLAPNNEIINEEQFSRIRSYFGTESFKGLQNSFIVVVGLGGVGSHAVNMIVRSGVERVRLIDFDQVTLSSLNRHAFACLEDVGLSKVQTVQKYINKIVSWCYVEVFPEMFRGSEASRLLDGSPDFVLDCIDDVNTKAELLAYCVQNNIKVITSMGAGGKADPTRIRIGTLADCTKDPLAKKIKWKLKKHSVDTSQIVTIFSVEMPTCNLLPLTEEQAEAPQEFGAIEYIRLRVMPVLGTSPAIFGQAIASYVLCQLAGAPYLPEPGERISRAQKQRMLQSLRNDEVRRFGFQGDDLGLDEDDVEFIIQQVWHNRCVITGKRIGAHASMTILRWNPEQPLTPYNVILLVQSEAKRLIEKSDYEALDINIRKKLEARLEWAKATYASHWDRLVELEVEPTLPQGQLLSSIVQDSKFYVYSFVLSVTCFLAGISYSSVRRPR